VPLDLTGILIVDHTLIVTIASQTLRRGLAYHSATKKYPNWRKKQLRCGRVERYGKNRCGNKIKTYIHVCSFCYKWISNPFQLQNQTSEQFLKSSLQHLNVTNQMHKIVIIINIQPITNTKDVKSHIYQRPQNLVNLGKENTNSNNTLKGFKFY